MAENTNSEDGEVVQWVETPAELERRPDCECAEPTQTDASLCGDGLDGRRSGQSPEAPGSESPNHAAESNEKTVSKQGGRREPQPEVGL